MKKLFLTLTAVSALGLAFAQAEETIEITGNDAMQFAPKELKAKAGQKFTLKLKHTGALPKLAMGHNVVILKPGTVVATFATKCMAASTTEYIPQDEETKSQIVAHTALIGGGEETSVEIEGLEPGVYPFVCTFPGHFAIMNGTLTVE